MGLAYGACDARDASHPRRHTYVIDGEGIVRQAIDTRDPAGQADAILATL